MKDPYFPFFPEDWLSDEKLRACSLAARGLWIDLLCLMHKNDSRGRFELNGKPLTTEQLSRMVGCSMEEATNALAELINAGVPSVEGGILISRRMRRDEAVRQFRSDCGKKGAVARWPTEGKSLRQRMLAVPKAWQTHGKPDANGDAKAMPIDPDPEPEPKCGEESPCPSCSEPQAASEPNESLFPVGKEAPKQKARDRKAPADGAVTGLGDDSASESPPVLIFPTVGPIAEWALTQRLLGDLQILFPALDVLGECRRALAWILAAPAHRKTAKGMRRFITNWLARSNDRSARSRGTDGQSGGSMGRPGRVEPPEGKYTGIGREIGGMSP